MARLQWAATCIKKEIKIITFRRGVKGDAALVILPITKIMFCAIPY